MAFGMKPPKNAANLKPCPACGSLCHNSEAMRAQRIIDDATARIESAGRVAAELENAKKEIAQLKAKIIQLQNPGARRKAT